MRSRSSVVTASTAFQLPLPSLSHRPQIRPQQCDSRTSHIVPPPRHRPPNPPSRPVIAWLSSTRRHNASVISAASLSARRVVPVRERSAASVALAAAALFANVVYVHAHHVTPADLSLLRAHGLSPVLVGRSPAGSFNIAGVAMAVAAAPVLLERKGDAVTKFFDDSSNHAGRLVEEDVIDERGAWERLVAWLTRIYLPTGFPDTTTPDYISFTKYRTIQNLASAIMQVISTEALLFGLGLGKKVAAGAAATSWVLKDGASYIVKILYGGLFGAKFDDDPKSWRIAADIVEDIGGAIEILTPLFPMGYFLPLASLAVCLRGMSLMTGTATRHVVYRSLAASGMQNTGDIATKGESQGVTMKMIGLGTGIVVSSRIGQNYYALLAAYGVLAGVHIAANWKSVQCVQFSFFNKQRASILIENHLKGEPIPTPHQVSSIETVILPPWRGFEPSVKIGAGVKDAVTNAQSLDDAKGMFRGERFLIFTHDGGSKVRILLREKATSRDALRAYYTVKKYVFSGERTPQNLEEAYKYMKRNIRAFEKKSAEAGWDTRHMLLTDSLVRVRW